MDIVGSKGRDDCSNELALAVCKLLLFFRLEDRLPTLPYARKESMIYERQNFEGISNENLKSLQSSDQPVLVADAVCKHNIGKFAHHSRGSGIHKVQSTLVIWFLEMIFVGEPGGGQYDCLLSWNPSIYLWKPRPSIRTTIQALGRRTSVCSNSRTYSYLRSILNLCGFKSLGRAAYFEFAISRPFSRLSTQYIREQLSQIVQDEYTAQLSH
jgi:hypothetical protein